MKSRENNDIDNKLISVIVPVYNVESYLRECLDSIINQTYKNIEIILINDGSTDASGKICDEYDNSYENIKVIHKKNEGLGFARNTGLENVNGEYVTFVDSDDYVDKDFFTVLYKNMIEQNLDMCKSGFKRVDDNHNIISERKYCKDVYQKNEVKNKFLPRMFGSLPDKKDSIEMCVCGVLYKTSYILEYDIKFPSERVLISEDLIFNIDYMQHITKAAIIDYIGYNYRCNPSSLTRKYRKDRFEASKYLYTEVKKKLTLLGYDNETILRLSRLFFIYLKTCLSQEKSKVSNKKYKETIYSLKNICNDSLVKQIIDNYPITKLDIKQKLFLYLVKYKCVRTIYILSTINII